MSSIEVLRMISNYYNNSGLRTKKHKELWSKIYEWSKIYWIAGVKKIMGKFEKFFGKYAMESIKWKMIFFPLGKIATYNCERVEVVLNWSKIKY